LSDFRDPWFDDFRRRIDKAQDLDDENENDEAPALSPPPMLQEVPQQSPVIKWRVTKTTLHGRDWFSELLGIVEAPTQREASRIAREKFGVSWNDGATLLVEKLTP
jgi:hypothetical protein